MTGKYKQIDHTADIAFEVSGESLEELFSVSVDAWRCSVVEETKYYERERKRIDLRASSKEQLLVEFLNEINFYLLTKKWLLSRVHEIEIKGEELEHIESGESPNQTTISMNRTVNGDTANLEEPSVIVDLHIPNETTIESIIEIEQGIGIARFNSFEELMNDLDE